jgi:DNA-binding HxlR family transcriptional regulator
LPGVSQQAPCNRHDVGTIECPAYRAIHILQDKWVLHIVHALLAGPRGFNELGREVGGCNPTTLAQRLTRLEELGIVTKSVTHEVPVRTSYALTPVGEGLSTVIAAIQSWAASHLAAST